MVRRDHWSCVLLLAVVSTLVTAPSASAQVTYKFTDLGTLGGDTSVAYGINNSGQVTGYSTMSTGPNRAFLYSGGVMKNLGVFAGHEGASSAGYAINDSGQVTGDGGGHAFLYSAGTMTDLGDLGNYIYPQSFGRGINKTGQVTGWSYTVDGFEHAFLYSGGAMQDLGTLGGHGQIDYSYGFGVNDNGQVAGSFAASVGVSHAFLYSGGKMNDLGTLGAPLLDSNALGINNAGQVTGWAYTDIGGLGYARAFLYSGGVMTDLGTMGWTESRGYGINNSGQVVGGVTNLAGMTGKGHAFLYTPGTGMVDLNTVVPVLGWTFVEAQAINDAGDIVGYAKNPIGKTHAFLLSVKTISAPTNVVATQYGDDGTTIRLTWNYAADAIDSFEIHRQPPSGADYVIPVDPTVVCTGSSARICAYDDAAITPYGTYSYRIRAVKGGNFSKYSDTSTAYQLKTVIDNVVAIDSTFTPDPSSDSLHDVAVSLGFNHFNWLQTVTHEPSCNPLHNWSPNSGSPIQGAELVAPHLDPPIGGYFEFGYFEDGNSGPGDALPYYWDENPVPGIPQPWYLDGTNTHFLNPGGELTSRAAGGDQETSKTAELWDRPQEPCMPDFSSPDHKASDYMGFTTTLVGVKTGLGATPTNSTALASFVWNSNYNGKTGGVTRRGWPSSEIVTDGTGGVFNVARVDTNSLPLAVRQILIQNGVQGVSSAPDTSQHAPMTAAFLSGTQGTNGWYTSPVQVTLIATDIDGPNDVASTTYTVDGGAPIDYSAPFSVPSDGVHTIDFGSVDTAANIETPRPSKAFSIDQTAPTSQVASLPATGSATTFTVQWTGTDAGSGVQDFTLYVSDNNGPFTAFVMNWPVTFVTFTGQAGHTYGFYSIARDLAGNVEGAKPVAEATTTVAEAATTPTLTTAAVTAITQTTATGGGNVTSDGGASVTGRGVCWGTSANPTTANTCTTDSSGTGAFTSSITGLTANTGYHVRAYATNSVGTAYGADVAFTTLVPPPADFQIGMASGGNSSASVAAGSSAAYSLAVTPANGFTGTISLACSGLPAGAACSPAQVSVSGSSPTGFTLTVTTTTRNRTAGITTTSPVLPGHGPRLAAFAFALVLGTLMIGVSAQRRRQFALVTLMLIVVAVGFVACGGSQHATTTTGTPAGTYPVVVSASSGSLSHNTNLTLNVN